MKKSLLVALVLLLLAQSSTAASTDASAAYMPEQPSYDIMPLQDSPIEVAREDLTFAMRESHAADVKAVYSLKNTSAENKTVPLAFPFVLELNDNSMGDSLSVTANGAQVPMKMQILGGLQYPVAQVGTKYVYYDYFSHTDLFKDAVNPNNLNQALQASAYTPKNFDPSALITDYKMDLSEKYESSYCVQIEFNIDPLKTTVMSYGFSTCIIDGTKVTLSSWRYQDYQDCGFILIGEDSISNMDVKIYTTDFLNDLDKEAADKLIKTEDAAAASASLNRLVVQPILDKYDSKNMLDAAQVLSLIEQKIDAMIGSDKHVFAESDLQNYIIDNAYMAVMLYDLPFEPNEEINLCVSYTLEATSDRRESDSMAYTYAYIQSPLKGFQSVGDVNIRVIPGGVQKYITASSVKFAQTDDGAYEATYAGASDKDIVFTMYTSPELVKTISDDGLLFSKIPIWIIIAGGSALVIAVLIIVGHIRARQKKKAKLSAAHMKQNDLNTP